MEFWRKKENPEKELFVTDHGLRVTAAGFERFDRELREVLQKKGEKELHPRKLGMILCKNVPGAVMGYLSFLRDKTVPILVDAKMQQNLIADILEKYDPDYIWCPMEMKGRYLDEITGNKGLMESELCHKNTKSGVRREEELSAENRQQENDGTEKTRTNGALKFEGYGYCLIKRKVQHPVRLHPELALLLSTSGSTGSGKMVRLSYNNLQKNAESIAEYLELNEEERPITSLPMNYTYGLSVIHSHLLVGGTILLTEKSVFEQEFWDFLKKEGATSLSGVPYTYEMLKWMRFDRMSLPTLRTLTQAGGHLQSALQREFGEYALRTGRKFYIMYGQTEATARMTYLPPEKVCEKIGSIGIPIPGGKMELAEDGELIYRGENVSMGYATCLEDLEKGDERYGILYTGDLGRKDADGYFYITGRKKRFLKILGKRIQLDEVENRLQEHFTERTIACTGTDQVLTIWVETSTLTVGGEEQVKEYLGEMLKLNPQVFCVRKIAKIPVNANGKRDYKQLEKLAKKKEDDIM